MSGAPSAGPAIFSTRDVRVVVSASSVSAPPTQKAVAKVPIEAL